MPYKSEDQDVAMEALVQSQHFSGLKAMCGAPGAVLEIDDSELPALAFDSPIDDTVRVAGISSHTRNAIAEVGVRFAYAHQRSFCDLAKALRSWEKAGIYPPSVEQQHQQNKGTNAMYAGGTTTSLACKAAAQAARQEFEINGHVGEAFLNESSVPKSKHQVHVRIVCALLSFDVLIVIICYD